MLDIAVARVPTDARKNLKQLLEREPGTVTCNLNELRPIDVPFKDASQLTDNIPVCFPLFRMSAESYDIIEEEIESMLAE